jgi:hypothetical protein
MDDRKTVMLVGAKTNWSRPMRAAMLRGTVESWIRVARKVYQWVAAGPKMTVWG